MSKETKPEVKEVRAEKSDREVRFEAHLAKYKVANPVKYAQKEARGEFAKIPVSFK